MKILVLIRGATRDPDDQHDHEVLGLYEQHTLSTALQLKKDTAGIELGVMAAGPEHENRVLAAAHAAGADRTIRLWDPLFAEVDAMGLAEALAFAAQKVGFDLLMTGMRSVDSSQGFYGPALAECLELPHITGVTSARIEPDEKSIRIQRPLGHQAWEHTISLPCLITVAAGPELPPAPPDDDHEPQVLGLKDIDLSEEIIRPRAHLRGTYATTDTSSSAHETAWVEDGAAAITRLRKLEYLVR